MKITAHECEHCHAVERADEGCARPYHWMRLRADEEGNGLILDVEVCSRDCAWSLLDRLRSS